MAALVLPLGVLVAVACDQTSSSGPDGGATGGAGGCPTGVFPWFTLHVTAHDGALPPDTTVVVTWSVRVEPPFKLDDPSTWKTLEQGTNVVCSVDRDAAPPTDLQELVCELWTNGATQVEVSATDYLTAEKTFTPAQRDGCTGPVPSDVAIEIVRDPDAGGA